MGILETIIIPLLSNSLLVGFAPTLNNFEPQSFKVTVFDRLTAALTENNRLSEGERLYEGKIHGPESLAVYDGSIYTGTSDGYITKITNDQVTCFTKLHKDNGKAHSSRPLGLRIDERGILYVADGFLGVFSVDTKTGSVTPLVTIGDEVGGKPVTFPDDLSISSDGVIYFSDGSVKRNLKTVGLSVVEHENSGRLIKFDLKTNKSSVLKDGIFFPNGVQLSKSEDSVLVSEFSNHRVLRHHLKGEKEGQTEVFAEVPGYAANIRSSKNGYWVGLWNYNDPANAGLMDRLSENPALRKAIINFQHTVASILLFVNQYWKSHHLENFAHELQDGYSWMIPNTVYGMAVEIDENGRFIQSVQSPDGKNGLLSEILEHDGYLYASSFANPYIIRMKE